MHKTEQLLADAEFDNEEFADRREEVLMAQAIMGKDVSDFMEGPVGRWVIGSATQDLREIEEKLAGIRPNTRLRRRRIEDLQMEHKAISKALSWLTDAVVMGRAAYRELNEPVE